MKCHVAACDQIDINGDVYTDLYILTQRTCICVEFHRKCLDMSEWGVYYLYRYKHTRIVINLSVKYSNKEVFLKTVEGRDEDSR
jgi:hypothetical protein